MMNGDLLSPVEITFDGSGAAVSASVLFEYETGGPRMAATVHMDSALSNPDTVNLPASGVVFTWDASADVAPSTLANFQITIDDGGAPSNCSVSNITVPVELMNFEIY
ncbi:MAG: hypothetical protein DHS20C11_20400 [Lysobacteraceae bacterium]|nr:MAG: hypothetical protein DHS20C11_20400 [Xanthomonadaceae bacterium]